MMLSPRTFSVRRIRPSGSGAIEKGRGWRPLATLSIRKAWRSLPMTPAGITSGMSVLNSVRPSAARFSLIRIARPRIWFSSRVPDQAGIPVAAKPSEMLLAISSTESPWTSARPTSGLPCAAPSRFSPWQTAQFWA